MPGNELIAYLDSTRTRADEELMLASLRAEGDNDPQTALDLYLQTARIVGAPHERNLRDLIRLGADTPSWAVARWVVDQAGLWMLMTKDPRTDDAVRLTMAAAYPELAELDAQGIYELGTRIAACDRLYSELVLYEMAGLADYVDAVAGDALLSRAPFVGSWSHTGLGAYRYEEVVDNRIVVTDLAVDEPVELLHVGCMSGAAPGQHVLGRVVPIADDPGLMFARRPVAVDRETAYATLVSPDAAPFPGWLLAVGNGVDDGRLPPRFGVVGPTPLTSDIVDDPLRLARAG